MAKESRWGGKGKKWSMRLIGEHDLAKATRHALGGVGYHLAKMTHFVERLRRGGTWEDDAGLNKQGQAHFNNFSHHLRAFFWELVAAFDTLLQQINRRLELGIDERAVDWDTVSRALSETAEYKKFLRQLSKGYNSRSFAEVREYRNFAHRGTVFVETVAIDLESHPELGQQFMGMMLLPVSGGRGSGEPIRLCKGYGEEIRDLVHWALEELDGVAPREPNGPDGQS